MSAVFNLKKFVFSPLSVHQQSQIRKDRICNIELTTLETAAEVRDGDGLPTWGCLPFFMFARYHFCNARLREVNIAGKI
jgi:hypothetical protein